MTHKEKTVKEATAEFMELMAGDVLAPEEWEKKMKKIFKKVYDAGYGKCQEEWSREKNRQFYFRNPQWFA